jgi:hypothetical protein
MELFIRIQDGRILEHPIVKENLLQAFPEIDTENLPPEFARFERVQKNIYTDVYEVAYVQYEWDGDIVRDVWYKRPMTENERTDLQEKTKSAWEKDGCPSWIFNEETCTFDPPVPYPEDGNRYYWDRNLVQWVQINP